MIITKWRALGIALFFLVVILALRYFNIHEYLSLTFLQEKASLLRSYVDLHYTGALFVYGLIYAAIVACGVPAVGPLTLLGGFLFGTLPGLGVAVAAMTIGATLSFLVIRHVFVATLAQQFAGKQKKFAEKVAQYGSTYILTLNLLTVVPFFVISTLAALTNIRVLTFMWTSALGSFPMLAVYAFAGRQFADIASLADIFSPPLIAAFVLLALLSVIPMLIKRMRYVDEV